jgi:E3 ubiquitin-protein ligase DOA10
MWRVVMHVASCDVANCVVASCDVTSCYVANCKGTIKYIHKNSLVTNFLIALSNKK